MNCMLQEVQSAGHEDSEGAIIHIYTSACSAISYFYTVCACKLSFRADYHCLWSIHAGVAVLCPIPVQEVMVLFLFCTTVCRMNDRPSAILVVCGWWWRPVVHSTFLGLIRLSWHWSYNRADRLNMYFHCHLSAMCIEDRSCGFDIRYNRKIIVPKRKLQCLWVGGQGGDVMGKRCSERQNIAKYQDIYNLNRISMDDAGEASKVFFILFVDGILSCPQSKQGVEEDVQAFRNHHTVK